jgi:hypothetical protein
MTSEHKRRSGDEYGDRIRPLKSYGIAEAIVRTTNGQCAAGLLNFGGVNHCNTANSGVIPRTSLTHLRHHMVAGAGFGMQFKWSS